MRNSRAVAASVLCLTQKDTPRNQPQLLSILKLYPVLSKNEPESQWAYNEPTSANRTALTTNIFFEPSRIPLIIPSSSSHTNCLLTSQRNNDRIIEEKKAARSWFGIGSRECIANAIIEPSAKKPVMAIPERTIRTREWVFTWCNETGSVETQDIIFSALTPR